MARVHGSDSSLSVLRGVAFTWNRHLHPAVAASNLDRLARLLGQAAAAKQSLIDSDQPAPSNGICLCVCARTRRAGD